MNRTNGEYRGLTHEHNPQLNFQVSKTHYHCSEPEQIDFGTAQVNARGLGASAIYRCNRGFHGRNLYRRCNEAGVWSGEEPICLAGEVHITWAVRYLKLIHNTYNYCNSK